MFQIRLHADERGDATLIATLLVTAVLVVFSFMIVPFFVYLLQKDHLRSIASHTLKEMEVAGQLTPGIETAAVARLGAVGMGVVTKNGVSYPSFAGSTTSLVMRDEPDSTVKLVIRYPASNLSRLMTAIGGANDPDDGYYEVSLYGRSEAYE